MLPWAGRNGTHAIIPTVLCPGFSRSVRPGWICCRHLLYGTEQVSEGPHPRAVPPSLQSTGPELLLMFLTQPAYQAFSTDQEVGRVERQHTDLVSGQISLSFTARPMPLCLSVCRLSVPPSIHPSLVSKAPTSFPLQPNVWEARARLQAARREPVWPWSVTAYCSRGSLSTSTPRRRCPAPSDESGSEGVGCWGTSREVAPLPRCLESSREAGPVGVHTQVLRGLGSCPLLAHRTPNSTPSSGPHLECVNPPP